MSALTRPPSARAAASGRRTDRFVLDSPVDPAYVWYGFGLERAGTLDRAEHVLRVAGR
ncbi:MAG: hypothetical protein JO345_10130 [Streptosporangiaceae bacterium]|nr:hypothetical protein [Streptosporangiaceae bacterium]